MKFKKFSSQNLINGKHTCNLMSLSFPLDLLSNREKNSKTIFLPLFLPFTIKKNENSLSHFLLHVSSIAFALFQSIVILFSMLSRHNISSMRHVQKKLISDEKRERKI